MAVHTHTTREHEVSGLASALTSAERLELLSPLECHLTDLEVRLKFLAGFFESVDAFEQMGADMLHTLLSDCRDGVIAARVAWGEAWSVAGGARQDAAGAGSKE